MQTGHILYVSDMYAVSPPQVYFDAFDSSIP